MTFPSVLLVMPAFNEARTIKPFLIDLITTLKGLDFQIAVLDDCSSDETVNLVREVSGDFPEQVLLVRNEKNLGHGRTTLKGLKFALDRGHETIVTMDGDGQINVSDLAQIIRLITDERFDAVEGIRVGRQDPWFRKATSMVCRILVWNRSGILPRDANTPIRAVSKDVVTKFLSTFGESLLVPNIYFSIFLRTTKVKMREVPIQIPSESRLAIGSTWGTNQRIVPSKRLLRFCTLAIVEWIRMGKKKIA